MITVIYNGSFKNLQDSVLNANDLLKDEKFYQLITIKDKFYFTDASSAQIGVAIKNCNFSTGTLTYKKLFSLKTVSFETPQDSLHIHINMQGWRGNRSVVSYTGTIIYKTGHCTDSDSAAFNFGHDGSAAVGNENTAP